MFGMRKNQSYTYLLLTTKCFNLLSMSLITRRKPLFLKNMSICLKISLIAASFTLQKGSTPLEELQDTQKTKHSITNTFIISTETN